MKLVSISEKCQQYNCYYIWMKTLLMCKIFFLLSIVSLNHTYIVVVILRFILIKVNSFQFWLEIHIEKIYTNRATFMHIELELRNESKYSKKWQRILLETMKCRCCESIIREMSETFCHRYHNNTKLICSILTFF